MKIYCTLLLIFFITGASAQVGWVKIKLDDKVSVRFPVQPQKIVAGNNTFYKIKDKDSIEYKAYLLSDYDVEAPQDPAKLYAKMNTQKTADVFKAGTEWTLPGYVFGPAKLGKWKNYLTYTFDAVNDEEKCKYWELTVFIGNRCYLLSCLVPYGLGTKNKDLFFNSPEPIK